MSAIVESQEEIDLFSEYAIAAQIVQLSLFPDITIRLIFRRLCNSPVRQNVLAIC
jgi:hypothetical protein